MHYDILTTSVSIFIVFYSNYNIVVKSLNNNIKIGDQCPEGKIIYFGAVFVLGKWWHGIIKI